MGAGYETREEAQEYGMSFGKYKAYQELLKYYPDITPEECNELSMNEIKNLILESGGEWVGNSQNNSQCTNSTDETKGQNSGNSGNGNSANKAAKTGDSAPIAGWMLLMIGTGAAALAVYRKRIKL